jgi:hypothetical protein
MREACREQAEISAWRALGRGLPWDRRAALTNGSVSNNQRLFVFDEPRFNPNIINDIANDFGFKVQTFIEPAPYVNYATTERSNFPSKLAPAKIS